MTSGVLMKIGPKLKIFPLDKVCPERLRSIQKDKKITILSENFAISGSFDENPLKNGQKVT